MTSWSSSNHTNLWRSLFLIFVSSVLVGRAHAQTPASSSTSGTSPGSKITFMVTGELQLNSSEVKILNLTLWDEYPVTLSDIAYYDVATFLNSLIPPPGPPTTSPPSTSNGTRRSTGGDSSSQDSGMSELTIALIAIGGTIGLIAIILAIYLAVISKRGAGGGWTRLPTSSNQCLVGDQVVATYPPPHPNSKVIQIQLVHHRATM